MEKAWQSTAEIWRNPRLTACLPATYRHIAWYSIVHGILGLFFINLDK